MIQLVFETHATSEDNERGLASGWSHSRLSPLGRDQARQMGTRRRDDGVAVVLCSDLRRASETAEVAFGGTAVPVLLDWRLRECDYGTRTREPVAEHVQHRARHLDDPYPGGESWRQAVERVRAVLDDLRRRWDGQRVLVIGHVATRWALDHHVHGAPLESLAGDPFAWQPGWEYRL